MEHIAIHFPFPWIAKEYDDKGWGIEDANGGEVMYSASFTGDGATIALDYENAKSMVELLNNSMANVDTAQTM